MFLDQIQLYQTEKKKKKNHGLNFFKLMNLIFIKINKRIMEISITSVCASFALSTFCASAQTLSLGTANELAPLSFSFVSLSIKKRKNNFV